MADALRELIDQVVVQGWRVEPGSDRRLRWRAPDGVGLVVTLDRVLPGRDLVNILA